MIANVFRAFLAQKLDAGGSETVIYLDRITTLTGETITTSDFSDFNRGIITVNPDADGVTSFPEYISFTGVSGLTLTGATRGLSAKSNSVVAANKRFHSSDTPVILSFGSHNIQDVLDYIDAQVAALTLGSNLVATATAAETVAAGELVYLNGSGKWALCDADTAATVEGVILGIAQGAGVTDGAITNGVLLWGVDVNQTGLTIGEDLYASNTAGGVANSAGTTERKIGQAKTSTTMFFDPAFSFLPKSGEKAALAGGGGLGTPSASNKFLTEEAIASNTVFPPPQVVVFTGSGTWTKDAGLKYVVVEVVGGGGKGGAGNTSNQSGGGGGGGGYSRKLISAASLGATETVTVGAGSSGSGGGTSSFGAHCSATGGSDGKDYSATGGPDGGAGGTGSGGDINVPGGGGPAGSSTGETMGTSAGGSSYFGGGAAGVSTAAGITATVYGSGGSGSHDVATAGGNGAAGLVIVTEYYS